MQTHPVPYELFALCYTTQTFRRADFLLGWEPSEEPFHNSYYIWLARRAGHICLIDTGFCKTTAQKRGRNLLRDPVEMLGMLDVQATEVNDVILTHMHYDHAGNFHRFPNARIHLQQSEMEYVTSEYMCHPILNSYYERDDVLQLVQMLYDGKVSLHESASSISDGISLHHIGGHTMGMQVARIFTKRGWVVVASDAVPSFESYNTGRPAKSVYSVAEAVSGCEWIRQEVESEFHVVPGHDSLILDRFPAHKPELQGLVARIDEAPLEK